MEEKYRSVAQLLSESRREVNSKEQASSRPTQLVEMATWEEKESENVIVPLMASSEPRDGSSQGKARVGEVKYTAEEAIDHIGFGKYQLLMVVYVGFSWMADAAEMILLSFIGPAAECEWGLSPTEEGVVSSAVFAGVFVGAYAWGLLADQKGRRFSFLTSVCFTFLFGLLSAWSPSFKWLVISRTLVGFGLGGSIVVFALCMEFLPVKRRGFWLVFLEFFWTIGSIGEAILAWSLLPRVNWRWLVAVSAIPFVLLLVFMPWVPESPKYLMVKGDVEKATRILKQVAKTNGKSLPKGVLGSSVSHLEDHEKRLSGKGKETEIERTFSEKEHPPKDLEKNEEATVTAVSMNVWRTFKRLFARDLLRTTLLLWLLYFVNSFVYYGLVLLTTQLDVKGGDNNTCDGPEKNELRSDLCHNGRPEYSNSQYRAVLISSVAEVPGLIVACIIVDLLGRKISLASLLVFCGLFMLPLVTPLTELVTNALMFGARSCSMGAFSILWAYAPELYYTAVRSTGLGSANSQGRLGGFLCPFVAVGLLQSCQRVLSISMFAGLALVAGAATFFLPKAKKTDK